jgi:hypothetical protein
MENYLNKFRRVFVALVTLGILLFVTFGLLGGIAGLFAGDEEIDTTDQVLYFELSGVIVDQPQTGTPDPLTIILGGGDNPTSYALRDVLKVLESIAEDENLNTSRRAYDVGLSPPPRIIVSGWNQHCFLTKSQSFMSFTIICFCYLFFYVL